MMYMFYESITYYGVGLGLRTQPHGDWRCNHKYHQIALKPLKV